MGPYRVVLVLTLMAAGAIIALQHSVLADTAHNNIQILAPRQGETLDAGFADVQYRFTGTNQKTSSSPRYQISLDGGAPVETAETRYRFTDLAPGAHRVSVQLAESSTANSTASSARFTVLQGTDARAGTKPVSGGKSDLLPEASSALPLLSVIGFGVLLGGVASALKTR